MLIREISCDIAGSRAALRRVFSSSPSEAQYRTGSGCEQRRPSWLRHRRNGCRRDCRTRLRGIENQRRLLRRRSSSCRQGWRRWLRRPACRRRLSYRRNRCSYRWGSTAGRGYPARPKPVAAGSGLHVGLPSPNRGLFIGKSHLVEILL